MTGGSPPWSGFRDPVHGQAPLPFGHSITVGIVTSRAPAPNRTIATVWEVGRDAPGPRSLTSYDVSAVLRRALPYAIPLDGAEVAELLLLHDVGALEEASSAVGKVILQALAEEEDGGRSRA